MPIIGRNMLTGQGATHATNSVVGNPGVLGLGNLASVIHQIQIYRFDDIQAAHWEIYLVGDAHSIKVDLMEAGYRVLYGAAPRVGPDGTLEAITLNPTKTLGDVIRAVAYVATLRPNWTGTDQYNCQDFVILLMAALGMSASQIFPYELRRAVTKHRPPVVTDRDRDGNLRNRY